LWTLARAFSPHPAFDWSSRPEGCQHSEKVLGARKTLLELMMADHPSPCARQLIRDSN